MDDRSRYESEIDFSNPNHSYTKSADLVGDGKRVVDFGCWTGFMAKALGGRGCAVTGIEIDPEAAEAASEFCERVIVGDLDQLDLAEALGGSSFDVGLFGDVIEHLKDPRRVLCAMRGLLAPGGHIVVSVPNVAHASVRLALLKGQFDYSETGILDNTHLRYYTRESIGDLLESCGYMVEVMDWTEQKITEEQLHEALDPLGLSNLQEVVEAFSQWEAVAYQYIIKAFPADQEDQVQRLAEEKVKAEQKLRVLESQADEARSVALELARTRAELERTAEAFTRASEYAKTLEQSVKDKDEYISALETAVHESRQRLQDCEARLAELDRNLQQLGTAVPSKKRRRKS